MNLLITGANGQLGKELQTLQKGFKNYTYFFASKEMLDITNIKEIENYILQNKINVIINGAAYTNVEKAEDDYTVADSINHKGVANLATLSKQNNISLIHISTDFVFSGSTKTPYDEKALPKPINNYGKTKYLGEQAMLNINPKNSIIIRTSWLYAMFNSNFVKTMLHLGTDKKEVTVINNQFGTPTNAKDLAEVILNIIPKIDNKHVEIYHYSNEGMCSWFDFAKEIMRLGKKDCIVKPINSKHYPAKAERPTYSVMNTDKIKSKFNLTIPSWKYSLKKMIAEI